MPDLKVTIQVPAPVCVVLYTPKSSWDMNERGAVITLDAKHWLTSLAYLVGTLSHPQYYPSIVAVFPGDLRWSFNVSKAVNHDLGIEP